MPPSTLETGPLDGIEHPGTERIRHLIAAPSRHDLAQLELELERRTTVCTGFEVGADDRPTLDASSTSTWTGT